MPSLDMNGPYELTNEKIDQTITRTTPGNYALGYVRELTFYVLYVGRSDDDVNARLKQWVGHSRYTHFMFSYARSSRDAFEKECKNYHDFDVPPDNKEHPKRPNGTDWKCPVCSA